MNTEQMAPALTDVAGTVRARRILQRLFQDYSDNLTIRLWNGETLILGQGSPEAALIFHHPRPLRDLILFRDPLRLAEAYFAGHVSVEGSIYSLYGLKDHLRSLSLSLQEKAALVSDALFLRDGSGRKMSATAFPTRWASLSRLRSWRGHSKSTNRSKKSGRFDAVPLTRRDLYPFSAK